MAFWVGVVVMPEDEIPPVPELPPLAEEDRALVDTSSATPRRRQCDARRTKPKSKD